MARKNAGGERAHSRIILISGVIVLLFASASAGCLHARSEAPDLNLTPEDAAYLEACKDLPMGKWDATNGAEIFGHYQEMYQIALAQKEVYEKRMEALASMPVSEDLEEIKEEYRLADEYGLLACDYEMQRARALTEGNTTREEEIWGLEDRAMDESLWHLALAKKLYREHYGSGGFLDGIISGIVS
ncbi:hypothetical protein J2129_001655 [Methanofollis sp. W23]|uniref:hypothetical protein n=1 Tax=Methanofollis sp. W23 TaxID=2817849 RepID=UPI001AE9AC83|nr:hypothetical protein [Methanofollis sp. W23]MBP2146201.1 hypothetical protein [Methanofollis sp. W23]